MAANINSGNFNNQDGGSSSMEKLVKNRKWKAIEDEGLEAPTFDGVCPVCLSKICNTTSSCKHEAHL